MANTKKYTIIHSGLYFKVGGKMQEMEEGSQIELDPKRAVKMLAKGWIVDPGSTKTTKVDAESTGSA